MAEVVTLPIRGYRDAPVPHRFHRQREAARELAIVLPGFGYSCDMPTLYFTASHLLDAGADVLLVDYDYIRRDDYRACDADERQRWLVADAGAACRAARAARPYERITLIGKSLGTRALPALLAGEPALRAARTIWFTPIWGEPPVREALTRADAPALIVIGSADPLYDAATAAAVRAVAGDDLLVLDGVDHGLEIPGNIIGTVRALEQTMVAVRRFTDRRD